MASTQTFAYFPVRSILLPLARCPPPRAAPLTRDFLSDDVWSTATVQANTRLGFDKDLLARQMMLRQGAAIHPAGFRRFRLDDVAAVSQAGLHLDFPKDEPEGSQQKDRSHEVMTLRHSSKMLVTLLDEHPTIRLWR